MRFPRGQVVESQMFQQLLGGGKAAAAAPTTNNNTTTTTTERNTHHHRNTDAFASELHGALAHPLVWWPHMQCKRLLRI